MTLSIHQWSRVTQDWYGRLLDLLFPPRCVNCKSPGNALCPKCLSTVRRITTPTCNRCGHSMSGTKQICRNCLAHPLQITRIQSAAWHEGAARKAVHALKYQRRRDLAVPLAGLLQEKLSDLGAPVDLITSVPLHTRRFQERGYNQAELLARRLSLTSGIPYFTSVVRTRATQDQIGLDAPQRRANVAGAFLSDPSHVSGNNVLLVDDVYTTGATLDACAAALLNSNAIAVYGLTVTRPPDQTSA